MEIVGNDLSLSLCLSLSPSVSLSFYRRLGGVSSPQGYPRQMITIMDPVHDCEDVCDAASTIGFII
jgi:hypothetical protein